MSVVYDPNIHKIAYKNHKEAPAGYVSIQSRINVGPGSTVDRNILEQYTQKRKFFRIDHTNPMAVMSIEPGCRIAYITKKNKWRSGGFFVSLNAGQTTSRHSSGVDFILYKAFSNGIYSLQMNDVRALYIRQASVRSTKKDPAVVVFNDIEQIKKIPVFLKRNGHNVIVNYVKDQYSKERFMATSKYKAAAESGNWIFRSELEQSVIESYESSSDCETSSECTAESCDS